MLPEDTKQEVINALMSTTYTGFEPCDVVIKYYGNIKNGAMLINHYCNRTTYPDNLTAIDIARDDELNNKYGSIHIDGTNISFDYYISSECDAVSLYKDGKIYTIKEAYNSGLIDLENMFELERCVSNIAVHLTDMDFNPENTQIAGDADGDFKLTVADATAIQMHLAKIVKLSVEQMSAADFDYNKCVDISDATRIQMVLAQLVNGNIC